MGDSDERSPSSLVVFGQDLGNIPCFRSTFLFSIPSGMVAGFAYFLFTSKTRRAIHVGYFSFVTLSLAYWGYCRYTWSVNKFKYDQIQQAIMDINVLDGTKELEDDKTKPTFKSA